MELKYKRILLKISGEALLGEQQFGIDQNPVRKIAEEIKKARDLGTEIAVVVGGGNIFRGMKNSAKLGMDQASLGTISLKADRSGVTLSWRNSSTSSCRMESKTWGKRKGS